ncbi:MAG TPA: hypothetical protein VK525_15725 [Candidatus Saccharimonadales bacterium]|nr:hypothetical protein [Candidatus Saccharimonadales bacterium]
MPIEKFFPRWFTPDRSRPALIMGISLFFISYGFDLLLSWLGIPGTATILNNVAIGVLGALLLIYYLSTLYFEQNYLRAKERTTLIMELNHHVRNSLTVIHYAAALEDKEERFRRISESVERIDRVLTDLVPTAGSASSPRYFLRKQN